MFSLTVVIYRVVSIRLQTVARSSTSQANLVFFGQMLEQFK